MKILQVVSYYPPAWGYGGPPRVMYELARRHVRNGHQVTVYTTDAHDADRRAPAPRASLEGIDVHYFPNVSNRLAWRTKKFLPRRARSALMRDVRSFDVAHIVDSRGWMVLHGYRAARRQGVPYVLSPFGSLGGSPGFRGLVKRAYDAMWVRPMVRCASAMLAQTDHEASVFREFGATEQQIAQLPLGFDEQEYTDLPPRGAFRRANGFTESDRVVLFIGRIHATQGLDFLVRCVATLYRRDPSWRLVIIGVDNGARPAVEDAARAQGIATRLTFVGPLYGRQRFDAMVDADVFSITSSIYEETSQASIEAAAAGLPLVVTEQADVPFLDGSGGGYVVPRTEEAVVRALAEVVRDRAHARRMGERARALMLERFTWDAVARRLEDVLALAVEHTPCG